jgi:hypothetical protein
MERKKNLLVSMNVKFVVVPPAQRDGEVVTIF